MKTLKYKKSHQIHPKFTTYENTLINSPKETRVQYKRYLNQLNDTLQSMITAGKLKRMEYISINNRAMFNRAKVQRSQWINQKYVKNLTESFQPETQTLKLDNRSDKLKPRKNDLSLRISTDMGGPIRRVQSPQKDLLDELIDQQIQKIKSRNLLKLKIDRKQIVEKACRQIENRLLSLPAHQKTQNIKTENSSTLITQRKNLTLKKDHRRSVTHNLYESTIQNIKKKEEASKRERVQNHKYFVRKLKKINANSLH